MLELLERQTKLTANQWKLPARHDLDVASVIPFKPRRSCRDGRNPKAFRIRLTLQSISVTVALYEPSAKNEVYSFGPVL